MKTLLALTLLVGCGGTTVEPRGAPPRTISAPDHARASRLTLASIACFTGGVWDDLQGGKDDPCRALAVEAIGARPDDASTRAAVRAIDPRAVERIVEAITDAAEDESAGALVRSVADAAREAMNARRAAVRIRSAGGDAVQVDADDAVLSARTALRTLAARNSPTAHVVTLVLAADRLENVRALPPQAKLAAAAPAFEVIFGVPRPGYYQPGAWLTYVSDAARVAGREVDPKGSTYAREKAAFAFVTMALAERFEVAAKAVDGEVQTVATLYASRLHGSLAEHQKKALAKN